jgi:hypothetical protein
MAIHARTPRSSLSRKAAPTVALSVRRWLAVAAVAGVATLSFGCGPKLLDAPGLPYAQTPTFVAMLTPGVTIEGVDGRWRITGQDPSTPPFLSAWPDEIPRSASPALLEQSSHFARTGARPCWVKVPGRDKPLFGLLALFPVFTTSSNPSALRTYRMDVPSSNVQQALGGQISVLYEPYPYSYDTLGADRKGNQYVTQAQGEVASWVLWISDVPFVPGPTVAPVMVAPAAPPPVVVAAPPPAPTPAPALTALPTLPTTVTPPGMRR